MGATRTRAEPNRRWWRLALPAVVLAAIVALQHLGVLRMPLFADDYLFLDRVRHVDFRTALELPDAVGNFYRPFSRQVYFWWIGHGFGESAFVCHLVNLGLMWSILILLHALVAARAGLRAGLIAALLVGVHHAWDVPVLWGSGTQDLFAITFALVSLHYSLRQRWAASAAFYGLALVSKEVIVLLPILVVLFAWRRDRPPQVALACAVPHVLVALVWGVTWFGRMRSNPGALAGNSELGSNALAAFVHFPQVVLGLEPGRVAAPDAVHLLVLAMCAAVGVAALWLTAPRDPKEEPAAGVPLKLVGAVWVMIGVLPIVPVAHYWSTYYYAFALCGAGVIAGDLLRGHSRGAVAAAFLLVLVGSFRARQLEMVEVQLDAWSARSHISEAYVRRAERLIRGLDASLRRALPHPPARSTLFFAGVPSSIAWQVADGPYVRWAYRDSSLRSYFLSQITDDRIGRGPVYIFVARGDTLLDASARPELMARTAARAVLQNDLSVARGALRYHVGQWPADRNARYLFAWVALSEGDESMARTLLASCGIEIDRPGSGRPLVTRALRMQASGDTASARDHLAVAISRDPFDVEPHALFADLSSASPQFRNRSMVEAFAARVLAPDDPRSWRRWGWVQASFGETAGALHSFTRYRDLAPEAARADVGVARIEAELRRLNAAAEQGGQLRFP